MEHELPYVFDLLWDVKSYEQVERIAKYEGDCSDASPEDLVELFQQEGMDIPECLADFAPQITIWVCKDGSWLPYEPLYEELHKYRKTKIKGWSE
jgi:hypothetical protein